MQKERVTQAIGALAIGTAIWFWLFYFVMATRHPNYSHATKAISELGSWDAPHLWIWNIGGYLLPGLAISLVGVGLALHFRGQRGSRIAASGLIASGLLMALAGLFPGDFENRQSLSMIVHTVGALGSFAAFLVSGFTMPVVLRDRIEWRIYSSPLLILVIASIASGFFRSSSAPGLGQRAGFLFFFLWIALVGFGLLRNSSQPSALESEQR